MAGTPIYTITEAREQLKAWTDALEAARSGQQYSIGGRSLTRQNMAEIRAEIQRWHQTVLALEQHAQDKQRPMGSSASFPTPGGGSGRLYSDELWRDGRN